MTVPELPTSRLAAFEPFRSRATAIFDAELPGHLDRLRWNGPRLRSLQERRLRQILITAKTRSPFHARRLAGLDPERCGLDDLASLPVMEKTELMGHFDDVVTDRRLSRQVCEEAIAATQDQPKPIDGEFLVLTSGGSSGTRGIFVFDDRALAEYGACIVRPAIARFEALGGLPPEGIDIALVAAASPIHATATTPHVTSGTGVRVHQIPATLPFEDVLARVADLDAPVLYGFPSVLTRLARAQIEGRLNLRLLSVSCSSETMHPEFRAAMTEAWGIPQTNVFGSTEGLVGSSEPGGEAIVFASDGCIVEAVDEDDRPVPPGTPSASILITNLFNHVQPLIRYRIDDRFVVEDGDGHLRACVEGRRADVLRFGNVEIHPLTIISELTHEPAIVDHRVVQTDSGVDIDVVTTAPIDPRAVAEAIERALAGAGVNDPRASVSIVERLPVDPATGKIARFVPAHRPQSRP